jgi:hypothetical protein
MGFAKSQHSRRRYSQEHVLLLPVISKGVHLGQMLTLDPLTLNAIWKVGRISFPPIGQLLGWRGGLRQSPAETLCRYKSGDPNFSSSIADPNSQPRSDKMRIHEMKEETRKRLVVGLGQPALWPCLEGSDKSVSDDILGQG